MFYVRCVSVRARLCVSMRACVCVCVCVCVCARGCEDYSLQCALKVRFRFTRCFRNFVSDRIGTCTPGMVSELVTVENRQIQLGIRSHEGDSLRGNVNI